ncbi:hypothetical protein BU15DRAFT_87167 [Melanogaster broomeanus]|nr:hypothetical protein BU15DRAFT_87167 [Melanogaster broomeanus]
MKRGAERQLTKDSLSDADDDDEIEVYPQAAQGFQKADEAALAKRQFGGFAGFGGEVPVSKPFAFVVQQPSTSAAPVSAFGSSGFGTGTNPSQSSSSMKMTVQPIPPEAVKLPPSESDAFSPKHATSALTKESDVTALKYYKSLRGLNVSFLSAISTAVEKDPFFDVAGLVESYKNLRTTIQSEFDGSSQLSKGAKPPSSSSPFGVKPFAPEKPAAPQFSMPKPPSLPFAGFSGSGGASSKLPSTSGFSFPAFTPPPSSTATTQLPFALTPKSGEPSALSSSASTPEPPKSAFAPVFGTSIFGSSSTGESGMASPFSASRSDDKDTSKSTPTLFGSTTMAPTTPSGSTFGSSDKPGNVFGSGSPPKPSAFGFGKPGGSIGNPVGFGFGGPSPKAGDSTTTSGLPEPSTGFTFGAQPAKPVESAFSPPATTLSTESTPQPEIEGNGDGGEVESAKLLPTSAHDEEGEGEEDEETMHVVKCKVFRLFKTGDKNEWKDLGIGMFRLKKHKESDARRVLMRNSSTGRILINFRLYDSLRSTLAKTSVSFVGYDNSTPTSFRVRVKTEEQASELKQALDREVAAVQTTE